MAKPIPRKKKQPVVAKKKRPVEAAPKSKAKTEKKLKEALEAVQERTDKRYAWAKALYEIQPEDVQKAVDAMVKQMKHMAGEPKFVVDGTTYTGNPSILLDIQRKSHTWIAMRLMVACAEWGIRVGNFKAPKGLCLRCGVKVKKKGK